MQRWRDDLRTARNPTRMSMNWLIASAYRLNEFESKAVMAVTAVTAVRAVTTIIAREAQAITRAAINTMLS